MHEYHLSLNRKYRNTHFALSEEQQHPLTFTTFNLALPSTHLIHKRANEIERGKVFE
jgi:hypothetical protein